MHLCNKIVEKNNTQIWTLAADSNEYERFKGLLDGSGKHGLSVEALNKALLSNSIAELKGSKSVVVIHDCCDIRKKYAKLLENISRVRDLDGKLVNGYQSFNSIAVDLQGKKLHLLGCLPYSHSEDSYNGEGQDSYNLHSLFKKQVLSIQQALKGQDPDLVITHLLDRGFDGINYFELLDEELGDKFVIRLKLNRNADVKTFNDNSQEVFIKLRDKEFTSSFIQVYDKFMWRGKVYQQAKACISYEPVNLNGTTYWIVKVELQDRKGNKIFKEPMLLISNYRVSHEQMALHVYHLYLKRCKIEAVFKFLKDVLGWEQFRVRDFLAIKNMIVLCYFIGGYFYEIESDLTNNQLVREICLLADSKGTVSRYFFLKGLAVMANYERVSRYFDEKDYSQEHIQKLINIIK